MLVRRRRRRRSRRVVEVAEVRRVVVRVRLVLAVVWHIWQTVVDSREGKAALAVAELAMRSCGIVSRFKEVRGAKAKS